MWSFFVSKLQPMLSFVWAMEQSWPNQHDFLGMHKNPVRFLLVYVEFTLQSAILPPPRGRLFVKQEWAFHFSTVSFKNFPVIPTSHHQNLKKKNQTRLLCSGKPAALGFHLHVHHYAFGCGKLLKVPFLFDNFMHLELVLLSLMFVFLHFGYCRQEQSVGRWWTLGCIQHKWSTLKNTPSLCPILSSLVR